MIGACLEDTELGGKKIKKVEEIVMWYVSGNRDEKAIENPKDFIIGRAKPRRLAEVAVEEHYVIEAGRLG